MPMKVSALWEQAFYQLNVKLQLLKAHVIKLDEWKFFAVEEMHRRLGQLLMLRFPANVTEAINEMKNNLSEALQGKMAELDKDVQGALTKGDYLTLELIFQEVKLAKDADSYFINNSTYNRLIGVLEKYLNDEVESIKVLYMQFDIKEAHFRQGHLWRLERVRMTSTPCRQYWETVSLVNKEREE